MAVVLVLEGAAATYLPEACLAGIEEVSAVRQIGFSEVPQLRVQLASAVESAAPAFQDQVGAGTTGLLRYIRTYARRIVKVVRHATRWWLEGLLGLIAFALFAVAAGVFDREVIEQWQAEGLRGLGRALSLGCAVYLRLLWDGRAPLVGKALLAFAIAYGVAGSDLIPDGRSLRGFADDLLLVLLASRAFMQMCPDEAVEDQARAAAFRRARAQSE